VLDLTDPGRHDALDDVQSRLDALLEDGPRVLVVELPDVAQLSSSMFAALMWVHRCAWARGVDVVLQAPDRRLVNTLRNSGLLDADPVGVTRVDLVCGPQVAHTALELVRRWGRDRALSSTAMVRLSSLVLAAVSHGLRFNPRSVTITLRWVDLDRVRVDVRWRNCSRTAIPVEADGDLESTAGTLDALAEDWGFATSSWGPVQWMVFDTR
jgi:hypothetical protein